MNELTTLLQSVPWLWIGIALVAINLVLLALKITKKLIVLAIALRWLPSAFTPA